jgi:predicted metal-dependent enzyme (double-stranded beta helix superfamily)
MLLCWQPGQFSPVHGHGYREYSWIKMLQGTLTQRLYRVEDKEEIEFARFQSTEDFVSFRFPLLTYVLLLQ